MSSSVKTTEAPYDKARTRRGVVEALTMGARIFELAKSVVATSCGAGRAVVLLSDGSLSELMVDVVLAMVAVMFQLVK